MIVTRGKLTTAQASLPVAVDASCALCGARAVFLVESIDAAVDHRCETGVVGPTWTLLERPKRTAKQRAEAFVDDLARGALTREQAAAQLVGRLDADGAAA